MFFEEGGLAKHFFIQRVFLRNLSDSGLEFNLKAILEAILPQKKAIAAQPGGMRGARRGDVRGDPYS